MVKYIKRWRSWWRYNFDFLKVLFFSPFKPLTIKWAFGDITHGTPYFFPRKWVKCDRQDAIDAWSKLSEYQQTKVREEGFGYLEVWIKRYIKGHIKAMPIKYFGWDFTTLGWKTKWEDYRFEYNPSLSIVVFGKQLFISILPNIEKLQMFGRDYMRIDCYWESWLNWEYNTDKTKSKEERFRELIKKHSNTWGSPKEGYTDYYPMILNKKYLKLYKEINK